MKLFEVLRPTNVQSSCIKRIWHDGRNLFIEFLTGATYRYYGVPPLVGLQMKKAHSQGKFMWSMVRGKYPYKRIRKPKFVSNKQTKRV